MCIKCYNRHSNEILSVFEKKPLERRAVRPVFLSQLNIYQPTGKMPKGVPNTETAVMTVLRAMIHTGHGLGA